MSRIWIIPENADKPTGEKKAQCRRKNDASEHRE